MKSTITDPYERKKPVEPTTQEQPSTRASNPTDIRGEKEGSPGQAAQVPDGGSAKAPGGPPRRRP